MLSDWYGTSSTNSHVTDSYSAPNKVIAYPNQWQHVIVTVQPTPANSYGALNSNCTIYYNGQQVWQQACPTPQWTIRPNAFLGRSSDDANCRLSGAIDSFYFYNFALSAEAAALHYAVPRAPRFELDFAASPAVFTNQSATAYSWMSAYTAHTGVLQLSSSAGPGWGTAAQTGQWVNLAVQAGSTSVGATLPVIGGSGNGLTLGAQLGWSFEVTFQVTSSSSTPNMVLFDMAGATSGQDEFLLNFVPGSCAMQVTAYGGAAGVTMTNLTVIPCVTTGKWYHLVVAMTTSTITPTRATYRSYVNGVLTNVVNGAALRQTPRANAFIGRSLADASASQATLAFSGLIDALRWYDYAVIPDNVLAMFNVTSSDAPAVAAKPFFSASPLNQWTFDAAPTSLVQGSYVYETTRSAHYGVAYFRSSTTTTVLTSLNQVDLTQPYGDWLNLVTLPDYTGTPMPVTWGGTAVAFEAWVQWSEFQPWSRVFDFGACGGCDNVVVSQNGNTANSPIMSFHAANGGTTSAPNTVAGVGSVTDCDANANGTATGPLALNVWLHIVCEIQPRDPFELASLQAADYRCWVNGVPQVIYSSNYASPPLATTYSTPGPIPNVVARPLALMGLSNYVGNYAFNGWIDSLLWYNTALSTEAVQWHYTAPRPPTVFEVTASPDPRLTTGTTQSATFGWMASDPTDSAALQALHTGLISLSAAQSQYVDLTVGQGPASLGQVIGNIGDGLGYTGQVVNSTASSTGYSFEVLVKFPAPLSSTSSKVFEIGNGPQSNEVVLNYVGSSGALTFNSYRTGFTTPADIAVVSAVQAGQWYHIHVTLSTGTSTSASSTCTVYVNGVQVNQVTNAVSPASMARSQATLGRSSWSGEGFLTAFIDSFRVYDYVLPASAVSALYALSSAGLPIPPAVVASSFYAYQSGPQLAYTLDIAPPSTQLTLDTNFTWTAASTLYPNPDGTSTPHTGVAQFNGLYETGNSIDLTAYPDSAGRTFTFPIGGSMSFECWFLYYAPLRPSLAGTIANGYDYVFSTGGVIGQNSNNIGLTTVGWTAQMMYVDFLGATTQHVTDTAGTIVVATPGVWQHFVLSIQQLNASVPSGNAAASCTIYISGKAAWTQACNVPQWVLRPNAFLGRSPDDQNLRHLGEIDSFYLYNFALSAEAAALHYVVPRAPFMELVFDRDPQQVTAVATSQYTWQAGSGNHSGLLSLSGSGQYVDLSTATGANSIGTTLPTLPLSAAGVGVSQAQYGWTLEANFMLSAAAVASPNMVLLDIGTATAGTDELLLQFTPGACTVQLTVYGGTAGTTAVPVVMSPTCIAPGTWYSVIVTASLASATATTATYQGYINGVATGSAVSAGATIRPVTRSVGYIGRSIGASSAAAGTLPFNGVIDSVRLYDFAATAAQVTKIVGVTSPVSVAPPAVSSSAAAPARSSSAASAASSAATGAAATSAMATSPATRAATSANQPTSAQATSAVQPTAPAYVTSTVAPSSSSSSSLSSGAIAGIVIGAVVGALVLICLLWLFCCSAALRGGKKSSTSDEGATHAHDELQDVSTHRRDEMEMTDASTA